MITLKLDIIKMVTSSGNIGDFVDLVRTPLYWSSYGTKQTIPMKITNSALDWHTGCSCSSIITRSGIVNIFNSDRTPEARTQAALGGSQHRGRAATNKCSSLSILPNLMSAISQSIRSSFSRTSSDLNCQSPFVLSAILSQRLEPFRQPFPSFTERSVCKVHFLTDVRIIQDVLQSILDMSNLCRKSSWNN